MKTLTEWLRNNKEPKEQVRNAMRKTSCYRRHFIKPPNKAGPDLGDILLKFPRILDNGMVSVHVDKYYRTELFTYYLL